jgi:hypothetical protein
VGAVVDVGTDRVLVSLRRPLPAPQGEGEDAPAALWSPRTGELTPVPIAGRFLTDDGTVVGNRLTGITDDHPDGSAPATWRPGEEPVELEVPRGWKGEPQAGARDTVVGKLTRTTTDDGRPAGEQPPAAAVQWRHGKVDYLPPLGGRQSIAASVNRHGVVAGHVADAGRLAARRDLARRARDGPGDARRHRRELGGRRLGRRRRGRLLVDEVRRAPRGGVGGRRHRGPGCGGGPGGVLAGRGHRRPPHLRHGERQGGRGRPRDLDPEAQETHR